MRKIRYVLLALASATTGYCLPHAHDPSLIKFKRATQTKAAAPAYAAPSPQARALTRAPASTPTQTPTDAPVSALNAVAKPVLEARFAMIDNETAICQSSDEGAALSCARLYDWLSWDDRERAANIAMAMWSKCVYDNLETACDYAMPALQRSQMDDRLVEVEQQGCELGNQDRCYDALWEMSNQHASEEELFNFAKRACSASDGLTYCKDIADRDYSPMNFQILSGSNGKYGGPLIPYYVSD